MSMSASMSAPASPLQVGAAGLPPQSRAGGRMALAAVLLGFFTIMVDAMIVNVALPSIGRGFGSGMTGLQWVVDGYTLTFAAFLLSAGAISDRVGARQAFAGGLALFVAASAACGPAPDLGVLVAARLVQGVGAAMVVPSSLALLRETFPDPAAWTGQVAAVAALGGLTYAAIEAGADGFGAARVLIALAVAVVAAVVYLVAQARGRYPMTPLPLLRSRTMSLSVAIGFALNIGFYGMIFLLGLYLQQVHGLSALATGVAFLPMTALTSFMGSVAARLTTRFGARIPVIAGQCLMVLGLLAMVTVSAGAPVWLSVVLMVPVGAGGAMAVTALTALLLENVPAERAGVAGGVLNAARQLGGALAVAAFGALVADRAGFVSGLQTSLLIAAAAVAASVVATALLTPARRRPAPARTP